MKIRPLELSLIGLFLILAGVAGWLLLNDVADSAIADKESAPHQRRLRTSESPQERSSGHARTKAQHEARKEPFLARPNERLVQFGNEEDYRNFLKSAANSKLRILGSLDALRAVRVGFSDLSDFDGLIDPDETGFNFLVGLPLAPGEGEVQTGAVGFGRNALDFLGITGDNSTWGEGVVVAVIDTGIVGHSALPDNIQHFDLVDAGTSSTERNGHGTAVASLIAGQNNITPGVSPAVQLIDVRVSDVNGNSTSFLLAEGIVTAVDAGADVINISLGSYGDSLLVQSAVDYAFANDAVIVASSGNEGFDQPAFPAGYEQVVAVGAVDQQGTVVDFSNTGENLDITAPGLELPAAYTDDRYIEFTGTSASAPYVAAAVATAMSEFQLTAPQAVEYVLEFSNEAGAPGQDTSYGVGLLDVGRVIDSNTSGIYDIAAVSNLVQTGEGSSVVAVVQNQGTETISNARVNISTPFSDIPLQVASLAPGEIQTFDIPTTLPDGGEEFAITTEAILSSAFQDAEPTNNVRSTPFNLEAAP